MRSASAKKPVRLVAVSLALIASTGPARAQSVVAPQQVPQSNGVPATANSSAVQRSSDATNGLVQLSLSAILSDEGQPIDQGLVWHIFRDRAGSDGKLPLVKQLREPAPAIKLEPGDYVINVAFGRATLTRKISVAAGASLAEKFNINAGGLRLKATLPSGEAAPERSVIYDILNEERDQSGNRIKVITGAKPGLIIRLNAGVYQVVSTYGDANARVRAEVAVEPGKLSDVALSHNGTKVTFKLVGREGGEALADVSWSIVDTRAEIVKETVGALPTHILAAGRYAVLAKHQGKTYRAEFTAKPGEQAIVEVIAR